MGGIRVQVHSHNLTGMMEKWWDSSCSCSRARDRYRLFRKDSSGVTGQKGEQGALLFM